MLYSLMWVGMLSDTRREVYKYTLFASILEVVMRV